MSKSHLIIGKLPAGKTLDRHTATDTGLGSRTHPFSIAVATVTENIIVIEILNQTLPQGSLLWGQGGGRRGSGEWWVVFHNL
jgi:hypothetical protein